MIPTILIAGTHSGCGKTTVACGLMSALTARGLKVQPFKVGPDFIDPTHHTAICGRSSRNLDPFMMGEDEVVRTFVQASTGADLAVIEGVMGMFDGVEGTIEGSTAHVAQILSVPVQLVVDVRGMSRSANAIIQGFRSFEPGVRIRGALFNRVGSPHHRSMIERSLPVPAYGWIPVDPTRSVESRHLGLFMAQEDRKMREWGPFIEEYCNVDALARDAVTPDLPATPTHARKPEPSLRVGVARDAAFCFYYQENLLRLKRQGGELVFFSSLSDRLPEVDLLYLGGGYPELHAEALSYAPALRDIRRACEDGMPVYAECGGLAVLCRSIAVRDRECRMAGILPAEAVMRSRFQALGYVEGSGTGISPLFPPDLFFRGHEFHYSCLSCDNDARFALRLTRGKGISEGRDGLTEHQTVGSYSHAYFTDAFADTLLFAGRAWKRT